MQGAWFSNNGGDGVQEELSGRDESHGTSVVSRKELDILLALFALFPLGPTWLYPFQSLARPLNFSHYLFDRRCPHERSGCFVPLLQELFNGLL